MVKISIYLNRPVFVMILKTVPDSYLNHVDDEWHGHILLICVSFMLFNEIQRFLSEIKFDIFTVSNSDNTIFEYSPFGITFFS